MSESSHALPAGCQAPSPSGDSPALVVVVNRPADLLRAMDKKWYRIPLRHAPVRLAAEYLAFYQTGAFAQAERWLVRWLAPTRGYFLATRRDLIPEEPHHPHADDPYFRVSLGEFLTLPQPIPSRRLRRITFIPTTLGRLQRAQEINDLWIRSSAQERLWEAMKLAGLDAECEFPLRDDLPQCTADFALFCERGRLAVLVSNATEEPAQVRDGGAALSEYAACSAGWLLLSVSIAEIELNALTCAERLAAIVGDLGGMVDPPEKVSLCT
jgi:hypothetical protein